MTDRINKIKEQAEVILEWCRQQKELPEGKRDILELRRKPSGAWMPVDEPACNLALYECRLSKRPKTHKATVYWYRNGDGIVRPSLAKLEHQWTGSVLLGTTTDEFTEPQ